MSPEGTRLAPAALCSPGSSAPCLATTEFQLSLDLLPAVVSVQRKETAGDWRDRQMSAGQTTGRLRLPTDTVLQPTAAQSQLGGGLGLTPPLLLGEGHPSHVCVSLRGALPHPGPPLPRGDGAISPCQGTAWSPSPLQELPPARRPIATPDGLSYSPLPKRSCCQGSQAALRLRWGRGEEEDGYPWAALPETWESPGKQLGG